MTITTEYIKELRQLFLDVAEDSNKTELRKFFAKFETEECSKAIDDNEKICNELRQISNDTAENVDYTFAQGISAFEIQGFIKGFLYAKELMR